MSVVVDLVLAKRPIAPLVFAVVVALPADPADVADPEPDPDPETDPETVGAAEVRKGAEPLAVDAAGETALGEDVEASVIEVEVVMEEELEEELPPAMTMPEPARVEAEGEVDAVVAVGAAEEAEEEEEPPVMVNLGEMLPESPRSAMI